MKDGKKKNICRFLTMSAVVLFSSLSVNAKSPEVGAAGSTEQSFVVQKFSYDMFLPEVIPVNKAELERIKGLAERDISAAAEEMKTYKDAVLIPVLRELLNIYYADAKNPDMKSINTLEEALQGRVESVFAGYDAALEERLHMEELDYETGKAIVVFEKNTMYKDIKEIADRMGASIDVLDGTNKTIEDYMETGVCGEGKFYAKLDFGISMSGPMALDILENIDCIKALDLNAYIPVDTVPDTAEKPGTGQNGNEAGTTSSDLKTDSSQAKQDLNQTPNRKTATAQKKNIQKGLIYAVSGLRYKVLDVKRKEVSLVGSSNKNIKKLNVKETVTIEGKRCKIVSIESNAFKNRKKLKWVVLGKNIVSIGKNAFAGCSNLKEVQIKSTKLKSVQKHAFWKINKKAIMRVPKKQQPAYRKLLNL
ncbi:MAG: leucine-rich repeat protein [Eubacterium sp.]|nr:leucine-rich repeat protein [Eubacterium sp.]